MPTKYNDQITSLACTKLIHIFYCYLNFASLATMMTNNTVTDIIMVGAYMCIMCIKKTALLHAIWQEGFGAVLCAY